MVSAAAVSVLTFMLMGQPPGVPIQPVEPIEPVQPVQPIAPVAPVAAPGGEVEPIDCGAAGRPPDPRCDESLDGRAPPKPPAGRQAAQAVLAPPRAAARLVLLPVVEVTAAAEHYSVFPWLRAITTSDDGKVGVRPEIQYATSFVPSIGFRFFDRRLPVPGSEIDAVFRAGNTNIVHAEVALRAPHWLGLTVGATWDRRDDRLFAGIGNPVPGALPPVESRYQGDIYRAEALWVTPRATPLTLTLRAGVEGREYSSDDVRGGPSIAVAYGAPPLTCAARGLLPPCTDPLLVPGFDGDRRLIYERARLALDLRPPGRAAGGVEMGLEGSTIYGFVNDPSRHARLGFDALGSIGGIDRALLLRFTGAVVEPIGSAVIPFDELVSPTGAAGMRGLPEGLLRDRSGLVGTVEYRWLLSSELDASLFVDEGAVAGPWFDGLAADDFHTTVGAGLRFYARTSPRYWQEAASQGLQLAYSRGHGVRLLLKAALF